MKRVTFKVLFFVKRTKKLKDGSLPVYVRITMNGERTEFGLQRSVDENLWDAKKGKAKGISKQSKELNNYLNTVVTNLFTKKREMEEGNETITADSLRLYYLGLNGEQKSLLAAFREHNAQCKSLIGVDFAKGTVVKYESCYKQVENFIHRKLEKKDLMFTEITPLVLKQFETYLKLEGGCNHNSAIKYLANLKKIVRIGLENGWIKKNPYLSYKLRTEDVEVDYLNEEERR